jgi:hypothetical protein
VLPQHIFSLWVTPKAAASTSAPAQFENVEGVPAGRVSESLEESEGKGHKYLTKSRYHHKSNNGAIVVDNG